MAAVLFTLFDFDSFQCAAALSNFALHSNLNFAPSKFENKV